MMTNPMKNEIEVENFEKEITFESGQFAIIDADVAKALKDKIPMAEKAIFVPTKSARGQEITFSVRAEYDDARLKRLIIEPTSTAQDISPEPMGEAALPGASHGNAGAKVGGDTDAAIRRIAGIGSGPVPNVGSRSNRNKRYSAKGDPKTLLTKGGDPVTSRVNQKLALKGARRNNYGQPRSESRLAEANLTGVEYLGIFLTPQSQDKLARAFPATHPQKSGDHVTILHNPSEEDLERFQSKVGKGVVLTITHYAANERVQAVRVKDVQAAGIPHITLSWATGSSPIESNGLMQQAGEPVQPWIKLQGVYDTYPRTLGESLASTQVFKSLQKATRKTKVETECFELLDHIKNKTLSELFVHSMQHRKIIHTTLSDMRTSEQVNGKDYDLIFEAVEILNKYHVNDAQAQVDSVLRLINGQG
jgi:hypothetical protein